MTDLDVALRSLAEDLRSDPVVPAREIRRRGSRRRARRQLAAGACATAAIAALLVTYGFRGSPRATPPATSSTTPSSATTTAAPTGFARINADPAVFANAAGGSGLGGVSLTAGARVVVHGGCLVIAPTTPAPPAGSPEAMPRVLVLPVGTTWLPETGWFGRPPSSPDSGAARLTDGRMLPVGARITSGFWLSHREDRTFAGACPGTAGYAAIPTSEDIVAIAPASGTAGSPTASATSSASPSGPSSFGPGTAAPVDWVTTIADFPLAAGLAPTPEDKFTELTRAVDLTGLQPCLTVADMHPTDAVMTELAGPSGRIVRQLRLFPDDHAAADAFDAWVTKALDCSGTAPEATTPPYLTHEFAVSDFGEDEAFIAQIVRDRDTRELYIWGGHMGIKRVGNALLTISATSEATATPDRIAEWRMGDQEILALLGRSMCRYAAGGCD